MVHALNNIGYTRTTENNDDNFTVNIKVKNGKNTIRRDIITSFRFIQI